MTGREFIRFYAQTKHVPSEIPGDTHLIWTGKHDKAGYGLFWHEGGWKYAHRVSLRIGLARPIAEGKWALHREDCPKNCVKHITEGTPSQNALSAYEAGKNRRQRVTSNHITQMEYLIACGVPMRLVVKSYGLSRNYLHTWRMRRGIKAPKRVKRPRVENALRRAS